MRDYRVYPFISGFSSCATNSLCCRVTDTGGVTSSGGATVNGNLRIGPVAAIAVAATSGNVYMLDYYNCQLRLYTKATDQVSVAAGFAAYVTGYAGKSATDGTATADFKFSAAVTLLALDATESFAYMADTSSGR